MSFAQGPPGTDARSLISRYDEVAELAGPPCGPEMAASWRNSASKWGLPALNQSDHIIIGSSQSRRVLTSRYGVPAEKIQVLLYPDRLSSFFACRKLQANPPACAASGWARRSRASVSIFSPAGRRSRDLNAEWT